MKSLLDEQLDEKLKSRLPEHDVFTVGELGWKGRKNGVLLRSMRDENFDVLITADRNVPYQQNLKKLKLIVIVLLVRSLKLEATAPLMSEVNAALTTLKPGEFIELDGFTTPQSPIQSNDEA
jgi:hypothetical protein